MTVYIAGPFFTPEQMTRVEQVEALFDLLGVEYISPRSLSPRLQDLTPEERKVNAVEVFKKNVDGIMEASVIFADLTERDSGTIWEMGCAFGLGKVLGGPMIITWSEAPKAENVMLAQGTSLHLTGPKEVGEFWMAVTQNGINEAMAEAIASKFHVLEANT